MPDEDRAIRVMIVDDHGIVREGLRTLLNRPGFEVVGEASNGRDAIRMAQDVHPDVMLLDIRMPNGDGLHCLPQIKDVSPDTGVIILTTYANPGYLARSVCNGAAGYLSKDSDPSEVLTAVRAVAAGHQMIDPNLLRTALSHSLTSQPQEAQAPTRDNAVEELSEREIEVLRLLASGFSNAAIAETLHVSVSTVKTHVRHILDKLGVTDRTQAALWAVRNQIVN